jgi:hypothetical protein
MDQDRTEIIQSLEASLDSLQQSIEHHCKLLQLLFDGHQGPRRFEPPSAQNSTGREQQLKAAIYEAIEVLEESRKSFKSRQLAALRKKLICVLTETQRPE